jgi:tetratricopeptide (TPR) repeat protein
LGTVLQKLGGYKEAIALYEQMLKISPGNNLIYRNQSGAYFNLKDYTQAKIYLEQAKSLGIIPNSNYERALNEALNLNK